MDDLLLVIGGVATLIAPVSLLGAILRPGTRVPMAITAVISGCVAFGATHIFLAGAVLLHDSAGRLASAAIGTNERMVPMRRLTAGYFYGEPQGDGYLRLTYTDGSVAEGCYLTGGMPQYVDATPPLRC